MPGVNIWKSFANVIAKPYPRITFISYRRFFQSVYYDPEYDELQVWGVVVGTISRFRGTTTIRSFRDHKVASPRYSWLLSRYVN